MESYKIKWKKSAYKELRNIRREYIPKIIHSVEKLRLNPFPSGVKKLSCSEKTYRLRVGDYRIIYEIERNSLIILIIRVKHRKDIYKK
jgi:mRNA interferase RelE/StbE